MTKKLPIGIQVVLLLAAALATDAADARETTVSLERLNQRWEGASARLRVPIKIKRGENRSPMYEYRKKKEKTFGFRLLVSDRKAIEHLLIDDHLPPGTPFRVVGWHDGSESEKPGLQLALEFRGARATATMRFIAQWHFSYASLPLKRLESIERYLRVQMFSLAAVDEQLLNVPLDATYQPTRGASPTRPTHTQSPSLEDNPFAPVRSPATTNSGSAPQGTNETPSPQDRAVSLRSASVVPVMPTVGEPLDLIVVYEVSGLTPGAVVAVLERREILFDGEVRRTLEETVERSNGTFTSKTTLQLPSGVPAGSYRARFTLVVDGEEQTRNALFQIVQ